MGERRKKAQQMFMETRLKKKPKRVHCDHESVLDRIQAKLLLQGDCKNPVAATRQIIVFFHTQFRRFVTRRVGVGRVTHHLLYLPSPGVLFSSELASLSCKHHICPPGIGKGREKNQRTINFLCQGPDHEFAHITSAHFSLAPGPYQAAKEAGILVRFIQRKNKRALLGKNCVTESELLTPGTLNQQGMD